MAPPVLLDELLELELLELLLELLDELELLLELELLDELLLDEELELLLELLDELLDELELLLELEPPPSQTAPVTGGTGAGAFAVPLLPCIPKLTL